MMLLKIFMKRVIDIAMKKDADEMAIKAFAI